MKIFLRLIQKAGLLSTASVLIIIVGTASVSAQLIERSANSRANSIINWQEGFIETTARGTARYTGNIVQEELMALEAARVLAKASLVEMLQGVRINAATTVGQFITKESSAKARFSGFLRGAAPVRETVKWVTDSAAKRGKVPIGRATYRVCLFHHDKKCRQTALAVVDLLTASQPMRLPAPEISGKSAGRTRTATSMSKSPSSRRTPAFTGLIVDLENKLFLPVLAPEIITRDGKAVFNMAMVTQRYVTGNSTVRYTAAVQNARKMPLVGERPMVVKIAEITEDNRIIVTAGEAEKIATAIKEGASFLAEGRVVIALD